MDFIDMNPLFELYGSDYILDPRTIAANDNVVAINSCLQIDLTGQIAAESLGANMLSSTGGQLAFAIGATLSKGGRNVTALTSTAKGGTISRIVPNFEPGTIITVPRTLADIVVTEYGVAKLKGKTQKQRAEELIAIAHPDFRAELKKEAERLF
jgi:4-hydroxybutyrate CoA-transferase